MLLALTGVQASGTSVFTTEDGAIKGYDPVAYFKQNAAIKGKPDIVHQWKDATWHFASTENRDLFRENPEAYALAFGGHCAVSMGKGIVAPSEPTAFAIRDGVLYLSFNGTQLQSWLEDVAGNVGKAVDNWLSIGKQ